MTLGKLVLALTLGLNAACALAQAWPTRPIRLIIGFPPGGDADGDGSLPDVTSFSRSAGSLRTLTLASKSFATIASGRPAGPNRPNQNV